MCANWPHAHTYADGNSHSNNNAHGNSDADAYADAMHRKMHTHTEAAPQPCAPPVTAVRHSIQ